MKNYICLEDAIDALRKYQYPYGVEFLISNLPKCDVEPVIHAEWISFLDGESIMPERYYRCLKCGRVERRREPYCHCGAKMC